MDLGRLIRFIKERETSVEDVKRYVGSLRRREEGTEVTIGHGELGGERDRVLLSIAERAGAVELRPGGPDGLLVTLTGRGSPRKAWAAISEAKNRGWESYRSIERYMSGGERCRRRQILDHFGDAEECRPSGRCCDVCDPDPELAEAMQRAPAKGARRREGRPQAGRAGATRSAAGSLAGATGPPAAAGLYARVGGSQEATPAAEASPVDEGEFERLRTWRWERAEGKPAFTVAANTVLEDILRRRPGSLAELIEIRGIGPAFCEKHGESLLSALATLNDAPALASVPAPT
jgi:ATP-dependent DNA helicase RecQ